MANEQMGLLGFKVEVDPNLQPKRQIVPNSCVCCWKHCFAR